MNLTSVNMSISEKVRNGTLTREDLKNLASGDDINRAEDGNTPLGYALLNGDIRIIRLLLEHKASVTRRADNGLTPLHMAIDAKENAARAVKILLQSPGIEVDALDNSFPHDTPLMRALRNNPDLAIIQSFREHGASTVTKNAKGDTALDIADKLVNHKVKEALMDPKDRDSAATSLIRFIVAAVLLLLDYLKPRQTAQNAITAAIKMIYDQTVKPALAPVEPTHPTTRQELQDILGDVVASQGLESMVPPESDTFQGILTRSFTVLNDPALTTPFTIAEVKTGFLLALYQPVLYCDDSRSMRDENRWAAQAEIVKYMSELMLMFSSAEQGVHLRFINKNEGGLDSLKGAALRDKMNFLPDGSTKLGTGLNQKVLEPFVYSKISAGQDFERPFLIIVMTDGEPNEEAVGTLSDGITTARERVSGASYPFYTARFSVNQIGTVPAATAFLDQLRTQSQKPEFQNILHVTADKLDAKYNEFRENKALLRDWLRDVLTLPLGTI